MSRYQLARRVIAPIALVLAIGLLVKETCAEAAREPVAFSLRFGDDAARVRHVRVDLWVDDASIGFVERAFGDAGAVERVHWSQPVSEQDLEVTISLTMVDGEVVALRRRVSAIPGSAVVIDASRPD
jgi:hypothetical protein